MRQFYSNLLQIQSVDKEILTINNEIADENNRVSFLDKTKNQKIDEKDNLLNDIASLNKVINNFENELMNTEKRLEQIDGYDLATFNEQQTLKIEEEKNALIEKSDNIQNDILSTLEKVEETQEFINEIDGFLEGIDKTIEEIQQEVDIKIIELKEAITTREQQIDFLLEDVDEKLKAVFLEVRSKLRFKRPITFIQGNKCRECFLHIDEYNAQQVEQGKLVLTCSGCHRLISPSHGI